MKKTLDIAKRNFIALLLLLVLCILGGVFFVILTDTRIGGSLVFTTYIFSVSAAISAYTASPSRISPFYMSLWNRMLVIILNAVFVYVVCLSIPYAENSGWVDQNRDLPNPIVVHFIISALMAIINVKSIYRENKNSNG